MKNFALTGVAGYIAPRHLQAIKDTGNNLVAAIDPHDSAGILDKYFPCASFFTEIERFDRHLEKLRRGSEDGRIHYLSICSPNFLHDAHIRLALRIGADALCEKPLVLNPWNLDVLGELEKEYGKRIYTVLQLRVHPSLIELKRALDKKEETRDKGRGTGDGATPDGGQGQEIRDGATPEDGQGRETEYRTKLKNGSGRKKEVTLTYITSRGLWYDFSWKGIKEKSGGIATNIGVHFFDLLIWLFGKVQKSTVHHSEVKRMAGFLELEDADVKWFLSIDRQDLPEEAVRNGKTTFRSITVDGEEIQFSEGFTDLHTRVYEETLAGRGFGISDARDSIELVYSIRNAAADLRYGDVHPFIKEIKK